MTTILQPGDIQQASADPPFARAPDADRFARRAARFRALARDHAMSPFLAFLGDLAEAQHHALNTFPEVPPPSSERLELCRQHRMPPLPAQGSERHPAWRQALAGIAAAVEERAPGPARAALQALRKAPSDTLEALADRVLAGALQAADAATAPFVGAALQVYWLRMARGLDAGRLPRLEAPNLCPVCGSPPVASVVRIGSVEQGLRYLHCSLCATEWNMVRIKCSHCDSTKGIAYYSIEGTKGAVKAETCGACNGYLKILYMEHDHEMDPVADDLATLALDILVDEAGFSRTGPNLLLAPGDAA